MKWIKASERLPEQTPKTENIIFRFTEDGTRRTHTGWFHSKDCSCCGKHFAAAYFTYDSQFFDLIEWLDESESPPPIDPESLWEEFKIDYLISIAYEKQPEISIEILTKDQFINAVNKLLNR